jgi:arylsulfatase A-like enzyme
MGYRTPNIDRIAREGMEFTDYYGQQSCTAGRAAFITGQNPVRTGLTKVGIPGADFGLQPEDPTIAELGIAEATIVLYSTDNGPHYNTWPDAAITPWRSEKNSN